MTAIIPAAMAAPVETASATMELEPPTTPIEAHEEDVKAAGAGAKRDVIATSLNIAKLQAMSMTELNHMAKDLASRTSAPCASMRFIFHILQKNAERSGVLFSEGVLEVLPRALGFLRSQSFNLSAVPRGYLRLAFPDTPV